MTKPANFPARKLSRQLAAQMRANNVPGVTANVVYNGHTGHEKNIVQAMLINTKKDRRVNARLFTSKG